MLDSTVVCRRALGCEWGGLEHTKVAARCKRVLTLQSKVFSLIKLRKQCRLLVPFPLRAKLCC